MTGSTLPFKDEGYEETGPISVKSSCLMDILAGWSEEQKAELAYQLLTGVSSSHVAAVTNRLLPRLKRDFIGVLPHELAVHILCYTDAKTVGRVGRVSRRWRVVASDNFIWHTMYKQAGWKINGRYIAQWLRTNDVEDDDSAEMESGKGEASTKIEDENNESVGNEAAARTSTVGTIEEATTPLYPETENAFPWYQRSNNKGDEGSTESTVLTELIGTGPRRLEASEKELTHTPTLSWKHIYHQRILLEHNWREGHYDTKTLIGHAEAIYCLQFDDDKVISGSRDDTIKIWDIRTGGCRATLHGHLGSVLCLQYDDKRIISGSSDSTIRIWDLATCRNIRTLQGHSESVLNVKFDTKYIVSCSKDTTVVIWSTKTGKRLRTLVSHRAAVNAIQYENGLVVSASGDRQIKVWDVKTGRELKNLVGHTRGIACIQFDGRTIVSGSSDHTIKVWDVQTGANLMTLTGHANLVRTLQFNSVRIVSGSYDETLKVWDMKTGTKLLDLKGGHTSRVFKLQFSDTKIVSCSQDQRIVVWDFTKGVDARFFE